MRNINAILPRHMSTTGMIQGMKQSMVATPAMQLSMRVLQANDTELQELISEALAANPALEEAQPQTETAEAPNEEYRRFAMESLSAAQTLGEYLEEQIRHSGLPAKTAEAALNLIPWLNEHGFFAEPLATVQQECGLNDKVFQQARLAICDCEPAGVGAQDLRESLILQLHRNGEDKGLSMLLLRDYWEDTVRHRYDKIAKALNIDEKTAELAARRLSRLNPDPGSGFAPTELNIITPDILVEADNGELKVSLARDKSPRLALSAEYRDMMAQHADKPEVRQFLSRCFREGRELIRALQDRNTTILTVATAIVQKQRPFFFHPQTALAPLKMEEIAQITGLHVSTISRAVRGKYLKCSYGVFELRSFFSTAVSTDDVSADAAKHKIREFIAAEDPSHPLSDAKLEALLQAQNIHLARRTIAKYREQLKILPASMRKRR